MTNLANMKKDQARAQIQKDTEAYLANGGAIEQFDWEGNKVGEIKAKRDGLFDHGDKIKYHQTKGIYGKIFPGTFIEYCDYKPGATARCKICYSHEDGERTSIVKVTNITHR